MKTKCHYCRTFLRSRTREAGRRFCIESKEFVSSESPSCDHFTLSPNFYCEKEMIWQHPIACLRRQFQRSPLLCRSCAQGDHIMDLCRGQDVYKLFGVARKEQQAPQTNNADLKLRKRA
jgi:hypothetical protein